MRHLPPVWWWDSVHDCLTLNVWSFLWTFYISAGAPSLPRSASGLRLSTAAQLRTETFAIGARRTVAYLTVWWRFFTCVDLNIWPSLRRLCSISLASPLLLCSSNFLLLSSLLLKDVDIHVILHAINAFYSCFVRAIYAFFTLFYPFLSCFFSSYLTLQIKSYLRNVFPGTKTLFIRNQQVSWVDVFILW